MRHDLVLDILESVLEAARLVIDEHGGEPSVITDDLRGLLGATHFMLRRYRSAVAETNRSAHG